ncbi:glycosyltransferase family 4 protein [Oceanisphaera pacifica]|uniref:Glycosyltransferase family 4 protein n=1 Tax=Oceanisphaera pacifica TaxID=2818389 RepID=A0ABS3NH10_9GAMM|nr:glycosyltransferase family 4 protein [Oceanisphaera pacifica]MBO1519881.1 glycosyltransferase family 4 protein [Oceanisphaera pacifica]
MIDNSNMIKSEYDVMVLCLSHFSGGMELDAIKMAKGLINENIPTLLVCKQNSSISYNANQSNISYQDVSFKTKFSFSLISQLRKIIIKNNIKNIIFFGTSEIKSIYFSLIGLTNVKLIVRYGTTRSSSKKNLLHRWFYSRVNYHLCISEHLLKNVEEIIPISHRSNLGVIYTSTHFISPLLKKPLKKAIAIHVGRVADGKGQLDALQAINNKDISLKLVGATDDEDYLLKLKNEIKDKELESQVEFIGYHSQPQSLFYDVSIFLFPSHGEGLSNALVEALGNGLICITYDNTVFPEFKKLGFHIHLVRDRDIHHLQETIDMVIKNLNQEIELSHRNILLARTIFSQENEIKHLLDIIR